MSERNRPDDSEVPLDIAERLKRCRRRIDELDEAIVELLNTRATCADEIGSLKGVVGMETYQPRRERDVLEQVLAANSGPLEPEAIRRIFECIIDESRRLETSHE